MMEIRSRASTKSLYSASSAVSLVPLLFKRPTRRSHCRCRWFTGPSRMETTKFNRSRDVNAFLSTDLDDPSAVPYFLWDDPMTVADFKARLTSSSPAAQARLLGKLLREARDTDVWK